MESDILDDWKIYPRKLVGKEIMFFAHTNWGSHLSIKRTIEQIQEMGYKWDDMEEDVRKLYFSCEIWGAKGAKPKKTQIVKHIETTRSKERFQIDMVYLSDYLVGSKEDRYLLTIIDHFSKFGMIFIVPNKKSTTVLKVLKGWLRITGKPGMIQSDNRGEFNNDLIKDFLKHQGIEYVRGSPYHSQSQGAVEGFNRTVQNFLYLAKDMHKDEFDLNDSIYDFCMHYNNRKHTTTKHKPQRIFESRWDEELRKEVYENTKASRQNAKSEDYKEGEIVRISNHLKLTKNSKYVCYYKPPRLNVTFFLILLLCEPTSSFELLLDHFSNNPETNSWG